LESKSCLDKGWMMEHCLLKPNLLDNDKTKLKIEVYNGNKKIETATTNFKSAKFWLNSMKFKVQNL
jgi:hypothetical protein